MQATKFSTIMDEFSNTPETEESLDIAAKDWDRVINAAKKIGYKEGVENGSDAVFQEGFDKGYEEGFKSAFNLGKFKSLLNTVTQDIKYPQDVKEILDKTRRGACHICLMESQNPNYETEKLFSQVIDEQREHSTKIMQRLCQYFHLNVKDLNINESTILEGQNCVSNLTESN
ncbi:uncharacterized protein LOC117221384 [Megalopta genalis]|uniref:uncharacterized protein LOC117221384 n=1 Tax=Megalopta genalis TaxID=115081 RepID=UPI003FCF584B